MSRTLLPLTFANLGRLDDAKIDKCLKHHLQRIAQDCYARPGDTTKRKVTMEFIVEPICDSMTHECTTAKVEIEIKSKVPVHRSQPFPMVCGREGFKFNADFADDLDAQSLFPEGHVENPDA